MLCCPFLPPTRWTFAHPLNHEVPPIYLRSETLAFVHWRGQAPLPPPLVEAPANEILHNGGVFIEQQQKRNSRSLFWHSEKWRNESYVMEDHVPRKFKKPYTLFTKAFCDQQGIDRCNTFILHLFILHYAYIKHDYTYKKQGLLK